MLVKDLLNWKQLDDEQKAAVKGKLKVVGAFALGVGATAGTVVLGNKAIDHFFPQYTTSVFGTSKGRAGIIITPTSRKGRTLDCKAYRLYQDSPEKAIEILNFHIGQLNDLAKEMKAEQFNDAITEALD